MDDIIKAFMLVFILASVIIIGASAQIDSEKTISKYYPIYKNETRAVPIYKDVIVNVPYSCFDGVSKNITCYKDMTEKVFDKMDEIIVSSKIIGYSDGEKDIIGKVHEDKGVISRWKYEDSDKRNYDDPVNRRCKDYEIEKGVCDEY